MESTNRGMEVLWATRLADGKECVVKTRQKATAVESAHDFVHGCKLVDAMRYLASLFV